MRVPLLLKIIIAVGKHYKGLQTPFTGMYETSRCKAHSWV